MKTLAKHHLSRKFYTYTLKSQKNMVIAKREDPSEYGMVLLRENGSISRFVEKPDWSQVFSDKVNTGIYIISPEILAQIPDNTFYDFARDLFPKIIKNGKMY